jgi:hypothetical protein
MRQGMIHQSEVVEMARLQKDAHDEIFNLFDKEVRRLGKRVETEMLIGDALMSFFEEYSDIAPKLVNYLYNDWHYKKDAKRILERFHKIHIDLTEYKESADDFKAQS